MSLPPAPRAMIPALAAAAGVVAAHAVDYLVLFPGSGQRDAYLHATGHGYWPVAVAAATGAAALATMLVAGSAVLRAAGGSAPGPGRAPVRFRSLLTWQMAAFAALEAGERGLAGFPATTVLHSPAFWLGLLLQLPVAWLVVRALGGVGRAAAALGARWRRPRAHPRRPVFVPTPVAAPARVAVVLPARPRAPPVLACT